METRLALTAGAPARPALPVLMAWSMAMKPGSTAGAAALPAPLAPTVCGMGMSQELTVVGAALSVLLAAIMSRTVMRLGWTAVA